MMVESGPSSRRAHSNPRPRDTEEAAAAISSGGGGGGGGVSKRVAPTETCLFFASLFIIAAVFIYLFTPPFPASPSSQYLPGVTSSVDSVDDLRLAFGILGVPWCRSKDGKTVEWTSMDLLQGLEEFVPIYESRPIKNYKDGMGFDHSFGLWFITRWLKPDLMIEIGVSKGHSTWILRQAMPEKPIISITPHHPEKYSGNGPFYVDENSTYFAGKDLVDFQNVDWESVVQEQDISDLSRVLVFFDDHQNHLKRLKQALKAGFQHIIFDNNYDTGTGDHYSLRQICDQYYIDGGGHSCIRDDAKAKIREMRKRWWEMAVGIDELCGENNAWWGIRGRMNDDFNHSSRYISYLQHVQNHKFVESALDVYWEMPPVAGPSLTRQTRYDPARATNPIIKEGRFDLFQRLGLTRLEPSVFNGYTQMVYLQISDPIVEYR